MNAIPPRSWARCQLRLVVGVELEDILPAIRRRLDRQGFSCVQVARAPDEPIPPTRLDPDDPWVTWAIASVAQSVGQRPALRRLAPRTGRKRRRQGAVWSPGSPDAEAGRAADRPWRDWQGSATRP